MFCSRHYSKELEGRERQDREWERQTIFYYLLGAKQCINCFTSVSFNIFNVIRLKYTWNWIYNWKLYGVSLYLRCWCWSSNKLNSLPQFCPTVSNGSKIYTEVHVFLIMNLVPKSCFPDFYFICLYPRPWMVLLHTVWQLVLGLSTIFT